MAKKHTYYSEAFKAKAIKKVEEHNSTKQRARSDLPYLKETNGSEEPLKTTFRT